MILLSESLLYYNLVTMSIKVKRVIKNLIIVGSFLLIAYALDVITWTDPFVEVFADIVQYIIYIWLLAFWGASIERRITNTVIKHCFFLMDLFLLVWLLARSLKFYAFNDARSENLMWYVYYFCMLAIMLCFFVATDCMVNKNKTRRVNNGFFVGIPTICFQILAITNNYHGYVFFLDENYEFIGYNVGYYAILIWLISIVIISAVRIRVNIDKSEYHNKYSLPLLVVFLATAYLLLYLFEVEPIRSLEFTVAMTTFIISFIESLIVSGLIPSNVEYDWCFNHSTVNSTILNAKGETVYKSINSIPIVEEEFERLKDEHMIHHDANIDFCMAPIKGGYAVWENDVRDINRLIEELKETEKSISEATESLRENIALEQRRQKADERIRLYDKMFAGVKDTVGALEKLIEATDGKEGEELRRLTARIDILGVFLKRKSNLILLNEQHLPDYSGELELCFKESFDNLTDAGVEGRYVFNKVKGVNNRTAIRVYEAFESFVDYFLDDMKSLNVILLRGGKSCVLTMDAECRNSHTAEEIRKNILQSFDVLPDIENDGTECTVSFCVFGKEVDNEN